MRSPRRSGRLGGCLALVRGPQRPGPPDRFRAADAGLGRRARHFDDARNHGHNRRAHTYLDVPPAGRHAAHADTEQTRIGRRDPRRIPPFRRDATVPNTLIGRCMPEEGDRMAKSVLYMSMSLDGFITGPDDGPGNGLGTGGDRLHEWLGEPVSELPHFDPPGLSGQVFAEAMATGAVVVGRKTFDYAGHWGGAHHGE